MPGPVPKREEERVRRNKPEVELTSIEMKGVVKQPELGMEDPHPIVQGMWDALAESGQSKYYEPSDWQYAKFTLHFANKLLNTGKPSSQMLMAVNSAFGDLLVSEGQRRRVRMEVERNKAKGEIVDLAEMFKERMGATS